MAYFNKYYFEFDDIHVVSPARWRVDIMDSQGATPTEPFLLTPGATPLITERLDSSDDKFTPIIGRQITITYVFTGDPNEPLPEEFFEAPERRFRVEVRKNGTLDGVYFVKPDFSQYPDVAAPFNVQLKAIDGMGYAKGTDFDAFENGRLLYDKITLYDAIVSKALFKIFDPGTIVNVIQTLKPVDSSLDYFFLFNNFIHTDIFYDFVEGAKSVYDILEAFCKNFNARIVTDQGQIWIIRIQDVIQSSVSVEKYTSDSEATSETIPGLVRNAGAGTSFDAIPINRSGGFVTLPAVKKAAYEVEYKGINRILNFDWWDYDGTDFSEWVRFTEIGTPPVGRTGSGTTADPYLARLPYDGNGNYRIGQSGSVLNTPNNPALEMNVGQILDFELRYRFNNTKSFRILIYAVVQNKTVPGDILFWVMDGGGGWSLQAVGADRVIQIARSGRKREGNLRIKSQPLPFRDVAYYPNSAIIINIFYPAEQSYHTPSEPGDIIDGPMPDSVDVWPVKLGIINNSSKGRSVKITNAADFSQVKETEKFTFIDTGEDGLSNTIFTGASKVPVNGWESPKAGVETDDIERHMAKGIIDQYQRSVNTWQGQLYSNSLSFYNMIRLAHKPDKLYLQAADRYDNRACTHDVTLVETFEEGTADIQEILEFDIEDTEE